MEIILVSPATQDSRSGNNTTAVRWGSLLRELGHQVTICNRYDGEPADLMIALHAWKSREAVSRFRDVWGDRPIIVALTGTDLYRYQESHPEETRQSMAAANALIGLHDLVPLAVPEAFRDKVHIVHQSAPERDRQAPEKGVFQVCVVGHLREEKDPLRAAYAVRDLPDRHRLKVVHVGKAMSPEWEQRARDEMQRNPRYQWLGEVSEAQVGDLMSRSRLMVMSSIMEGGANVVSEACRASLPVVASHIDGNVGLLGEDYAGYYPVGDTDSLRELLCLVEREPFYLEKLRRDCQVRGRLFTPENERAALADALAATVRG